MLELGLGARLPGRIPSRAARVGRKLSPACAPFVAQVHQGASGRCNTLGRLMLADINNIRHGDERTRSRAYRRLLQAARTGGMRS
jgi:hypothetical protein